MDVVVLPAQSGERSSSSMAEESVAAAAAQLDLAIVTNRVLDDHLLHKRQQQ